MTMGTFQWTGVSPALHKEQISHVSLSRSANASTSTARTLLQRIRLPSALLPFRHPVATVMLARARGRPFVTPAPRVHRHDQLLWYTVFRPNSRLGSLLTRPQRLRPVDSHPVVPICEKKKRFPPIAPIWRTDCSPYLFQFGHLEI